MKKTALTIAAGLMALCSYAQTAYDALLFSENEYEGTARTMAMGNAFTALGGDLGSIGLNPAGSAVAGYSQVTFTPGVTITGSKAQGVPPSAGSGDPYFQKQMRSSITNFNLPNVGATINFNTGRKTGLKNFTLGFIANKTASYDEDMFAKGVNETTSFMGSMAYHAFGLLGADLGANDAYDFMPWKEVIGYKTGMISSIGQYDDEYVGASQTYYDNGDIVLSGPLEQSFGKQVSGGKYDFLLNAGANISDFLYIGVNLGIASLDYSYTEYFREAALDMYDFEIIYDTGDVTYFKDMTYKYEYSARGTGYYGKIGVILTPGFGLRIGAAIQTPTINRIEEKWGEEGGTTFSNNKYSGYEYSPYGESGYTMISPYRANLGVAYTLGQLGVVSADYEVCDYSTMKYQADAYNREHFEEVNEDIREFFKASHALRLGLEVKPISGFALRAGYGLTTNPETSEDAPSIKTQNLSFGLGYSSKKSFFADLAVRRTKLANEYIMPYAEYVYDAEGYLIEGNEVPMILNQRSLWKVALTLGWRF